MSIHPQQVEGVHNINFQSTIYSSNSHQNQKSQELGDKSSDGKKRVNICFWPGFLKIFRFERC